MPISRLKITQFENYSKNTHTHTHTHTLDLLFYLDH